MYVHIYYVLAAELYLFNLCNILLIVITSLWKLFYIVVSSLWLFLIYFSWIYWNVIMLMFPFALHCFLVGPQSYMDTKNDVYK